MAVSGSSSLDYDRLAADYARHRRVHPGVIARLLETGGVSATSRVLEVGCGTGNYLRAMRQSTRCAGWGVDPSVAMLARARSLSSGGVYIAGRAERLRFRPDSFDLVYSVDVIHHLADRAAYFDGAYRVLEAGGRICTVTDSDDDLVQRRPQSEYFPETVPVERLRYPTIATLHAELAAAGFTDLGDEPVALTYEVTSARAYRDKAFSSLHLIPAEAFERGLARLEADLAIGPVPAVSRYTLVWGQKA